MAVVKITKKAVDALLPAGKDMCLWDDELKGFGIRVTPKGVKTYLVQYRIGGRSGKVQRVYIGQHGSPWTCDNARRQAKIILGDVAKGVNVAHEKKRTRADAANSQTVKDFAERFLTQHVMTKCKKSTQRDYGKMLDRFILPKFGKRLVKDIARADISRLHHELSATPYMANRVIMLLSKMFNMAEAWGERPDNSNPCRHVQKFKEQMRGRSLTPEEALRLGAVLDALSQKIGTGAVLSESNIIPFNTGEVVESPTTSLGVSPFAIAAIRLLMFTGARKGEIVNLRWDWVDLEKGLLRLPDSKTGAKTIYLSPDAVEVIKSLPVVAGNPYVICGTVQGKPLGGLQNIWERIRKQAGIEDVRLHDLRHNYASMAVTSGMSLYIVGNMLGHKQAQTTMRYAHLAADALKKSTTAVSGSIAAALHSKTS